MGARGGFIFTTPIGIVQWNYILVCFTVGWPIRHIVMISDHDHPGRSHHNDCADDVDQCCCQVRASQQLQPKKGAQPQVSKLADGNIYDT